VLANEIKHLELPVPVEKAKIKHHQKSGDGRKRRIKKANLVFAFVRVTESVVGADGLEPPTYAV
jgi:hypothetical protein